MLRLSRRGRVGAPMAPEQGGGCDCKKGWGRGSEPEFQAHTAEASFPPRAQMGGNCRFMLKIDFMCPSKEARQGPPFTLACPAESPGTLGAETCSPCYQLPLVSCVNKGLLISTGNGLRQPSVWTSLWDGEPPGFST